MAKKEFLGKPLPSYYVVQGYPVQVSGTPDGGVLFRRYNADAGEWEPAGQYLGMIFEGDEDATLTPAECHRYCTALDELRAGRFQRNNLPLYCIWSGTPVKITRTGGVTEASRYVTTDSKWLPAQAAEYLYEIYRGATPEIVPLGEFDHFVDELGKLRSNTFLGHNLPLFCVVEGAPSRVARNEYGLLRAERCAGAEFESGGRFLNTDDLLRRLFKADLRTPLLSEAEFQRMLSVSLK